MDYNYGWSPHGQQGRRMKKRVLETRDDASRALGIFFFLLAFLIINEHLF